MPSVTVRQLEKHVIHELKQIAAANGRSMEQEIRILLTRFVDLPWESQAATVPAAILPLPRWYEDLFDVRLVFRTLSLSRLPPRLSTFRSAAGGPA